MVGLCIVVKGLIVGFSVGVILPIEEIAGTVKIDNDSQIELDCDF